MNSGAEAVETDSEGGPQVGLPKKRAWPRKRARIITCAGNFHGRTTTIISFSDDAQARAELRPLHPRVRIDSLRRRGGSGAVSSTATRWRS